MDIRNNGITIKCKFQIINEKTNFVHYHQHLICWLPWHPRLILLPRTLNVHQILTSSWHTWDSTKLQEELHLWEDLNTKDESFFCNLFPHSTWCSTKNLMTAEIPNKQWTIYGLSDKHVCFYLDVISNYHCFIHQGINS